MKEEIYIGGDHAGFEVKEKIKRHLNEIGVRFLDLGPAKYDKNDDYPDYAFKVGEAVAKNNGRGILICGSGSGVTIAANKVRGIRAVAAYDEMIAKLSREHADTNILCLSAWNTSFGKIKNIIDVWLRTKFSNESRHKRRIEKIKRYER